MQLIIAEKPSLGKTIATALNVKNKKEGYYENNDYIVTYAYGHLFQLKDVKDYLDVEKINWSEISLPFFPKNFEFKLKDDAGVKKQFKIIKKLIEREDVNEIINCGDADREGQIIIDLIINEVNTQKSIKRLWLPEQTEETIKNEINNIKSNNEYKNYFNEGIARTFLDWLLGINTTIYVSTKVGSKFNSGRVLIPIVKYIYDRDMEIKNFKPEKYYILESSKNDIKLSIKDKKYNINELNESLKKSEELNKYKAKIVDVQNKEIKKIPGKLFSLSKLQSKLSKDYKMSFDESLKVIQELYEKGYLTYPRTNTEYLATAEKEKVENILTVLNDEELEFKDTKRIFDDSKIESHSAITITKKIPGENELTEIENKIYNTVKNRFITNFLREETILSQSTIEIAVGSQNFKIKGETMIQEGFLKYEKQEITNKLPKLQKNDEFEIYFKPEEKTTGSPPKINEDLLSKFLENPFRKENKENEENNDDEDYKSILEGIEIGTQSTRTGIIQNAIKIEYISRNKNNIFSIEEKGIKFIETLDKLDINLYKEKTVEFSKALKKVFKNEKGIKELINETSDELRKIISNKTEIEKFHQNEKDVIGKCPKCGNDILENSKSYYCSDYKNCNFSLWKEQKIFGGFKISKSQATKLINKDKVPFKKLKGNKGEFGANLIIDLSNEKYTNLKIEDFIETKK